VAHGEDRGAESSTTWGGSGRSYSRSGAARDGGVVASRARRRGGRPIWGETGTGDSPDGLLHGGGSLVEMLISASPCKPVRCPACGSKSSMETRGNTGTGCWGRDMARGDRRRGHPWWSLRQLGCFNDYPRQAVLEAVWHGVDGVAWGWLQRCLERRQPKSTVARGGCYGGNWRAEREDGDGKREGVVRREKWNRPQHREYKVASDRVPFKWRLRLTSGPQHFLIYQDFPPSKFWNSKQWPSRCPKFTKFWIGIDGSTKNNFKFPNNCKL
jgi:hypothetical protein